MTEPTQREREQAMILASGTFDPGKRAESIAAALAAARKEGRREAIRELRAVGFSAAHEYLVKHFVALGCDEEQG